jgi:hypothetical protein
MAVAERFGTRWPPSRFFVAVLLVLLTGDPCNLLCVSLLTIPPPPPIAGVCVLPPTKSKVLPEGSKYLRIGPGFALQTVLSRSLNTCTKIGKRLDTCYKHGADELSLFFFLAHLICTEHSEA